MGNLSKTIQLLPNMLSESYTLILVVLRIVNYNIANDFA